VKKKIAERVHPSHTVKHDPNTITGLHGDRFGQTWECTKCGGEAYDTVAGGSIDLILEEPCYYGDKRAYLEFQIAKHERYLTNLRKELDSI
jgi:hypothetical protein